jgi:hypothetical protein
MNSILKVFLVPVVAFVFVPAALASAWLPSDIPYDNPVPVLQPRHAIPDAIAVKANPGQPTFAGDWVSTEVIAAMGLRALEPRSSVPQREAEKAGQIAYPEDSDIF